MAFRPRSRKSYIMWKNGRAYYRRVIPEKYRPLFGKTAWVIPLEGHGKAELEAEALAHAHRHNEEIKDHDDLGPQALEDFIAAVKAGPAPAPEPAPDSFGVDGQVYEGAYTLTNDPHLRRAAELRGEFVMNSEEIDHRRALAKAYRQAKKADTAEARELAELRAYKAERELEAAEQATGPSVLSILPQWRENRKQKTTSWANVTQYANEFVDLYGDIPVASITKKQVVEFVEHTQSEINGRRRTPNSVKKRLDLIKALLNFAVSIDAVDHNVATGVRPPRDDRPKTAKSWGSFTHEELDRLFEVSGEVWAKRKPARRADLTVALRCLWLTGARLEEICQLRTQDIDLTQGVIHITNDTTDGATGSRERLMKTETSVRTIPIHSRLIQALEGHVGDGPLLFPTFEPKPTPAELERERETGVLEMKSRYSRPISREWTDFLRKKVTDSPRKVLYSLRHTWAAESRRTGMPEYVRNSLMGHASDNVHAERYGADAEWIEEKRKHLERMFAAR